MQEKGIVLLVEDNYEILEINRRVLEKEGIVVLTAKTIAEARERVKLACPDVSVLDIILPDGNGLDFSQELRKVYEANSKPFCVLFLTAKVERDDVLAGLAIGGSDYITKPYNIDELRMRVLGFLRLAESSKMHKTNETNSTILSDPSILNAKELSIALLAAKGLYNKEIAKKVFLSESRVKTCLSSVYRKLGIEDKENKRDILIKILKS